MRNAQQGPVRLVAAPFTPFHADRSLDLDRIADQRRQLQGDGVAAAFVCGTTGEGASLTETERAHVAQRWCKEAVDGFGVVVHVGHASLSVACELARHAVRTGADAVAAVAPYLHRPQRVEDLVESCAQIAEAAAPLPFYFYHLPDLTGVQFRPSQLIGLASVAIPNFAGVKYTHNDLAEFSRCLELVDDRIEVMAGRDEILLSSLVLGARSAVGSTYNFAAPIYLEIAAALARGDLEAARRDQQIVRRMIDVAQPYGGLPAIKAMGSLVGVHCGPCRSPLRAIGEDELSQLRHELERIEFFDALERCREAQTI